MTDQGPAETAREVDWLSDSETDAWIALFGILMRLPGPLTSQLQPSWAPTACHLPLHRRPRAVE